MGDTRPVKSTLTRLSKFLRSLKNKDDRDAFVAARVATAVGLRIFNLRKKKNWSQEELAQEAGMRQARISVLEKADYENFSFSTLRRIAAAFGVAVIVDFVSFPDFLEWSDGFDSESIAPESFEESIKGAGLGYSNPSFREVQKGPLGNQESLIAGITPELLASLVGLQTEPLQQRKPLLAPIQ